MAPFLEQAGNVLLPARGSEDPRQQFLAANSAGWGTSTPTRPERQENEAGPGLDKQLQSGAPWPHADLGCGATAAALCSKEH